MNRRPVLLALPALALALAAAASPAAADEAVVVTESCEGGVSIIVDFTDIGGAVESGCAQGDPASGREALESAGFTPTNDDSGLICAVDSQPADPCGPFEGSFWAYWQVVDGEWVSSQVGADQADPAPGDTEGWRYNDGSVPPPVPAAATVETTEPTAADEATTADAEESSGGGVGPALWVVIGVVVVALVAGLVIRRGRSTGS